MKQYRMQNRYTNHLPNHFYCRHGFDLNQACSLCAIPASLIASGDGLQAATRLRNTGGGVLLTHQSVPASDDAGRSEARDAGTSGIWLVTLNATDGPNPRTRA